ncbi:hypothetical protein [Pseudoalteromonas fuliginea]|uniref:hypothetical protein n=1 Tax=Pseudoalteromonas fuliginea TaxID=1872678 RepID=UPI00317B007A
MYAQIEKPKEIKNRSSSNSTIQLATIYRGMKASSGGGTTPKLSNVTTEGPALGVRSPDDIKATDIVNDKVNGGGMSTSQGGANKVPSFSVSSHYTYGGNNKTDKTLDNFRWNWSLDTSDLPSTLTTENDHGDHVLVKPANTDDLSLATFRSEVQGTQSKWSRIDS